MRRLATDICVQVSEFAPASLQKPLSYVVGWCCCLGWIAGVPSCCVQLAGMVEAMIKLVHPDADVSQLWQVTLLLWCFIMLAVGFNIFFARHLPLTEGIILFLHVFGFFVFLLAFWIMGDHGMCLDVSGKQGHGPNSMQPRPKASSPNSSRFLSAGSTIEYI